ncbi:MAG: Asp-tRNA(Asn)/Glu-tRNA(Gln) amidotransferase subunit GatA [Phycisphaerae bacterium]|nr:Asp-tRNA(Asn)/Glu-tRNA(Gln) amidotransferase subunit GatA [Phycisphaerae bacterium]
MTPSARALAADVRARRRSAADLAREALDRAHAARHLNAFLDLFPDAAIDQAKRLDARLAAGEPVGPLAGVPVAIKDNLCLAEPYGGRTTAGSRILADYRSPYTASAVQRLLDAGAIVLGKANLDEFSMGSSGENSAFGPTLNPHDPARVPGGSSSGAAAAVAAGIVPLALGSDTGGSIRQPAAFCGIVGLKPTYGRVSRYGLVAYASSLDQVGPLARTVEDAALALAVIAGPDPHDATSARAPIPDPLASLDTPVAGATIGIPRQARSTANHPAVAAGLERAASALADAGARVIDIDLPHADRGIAAYYIVALAEASSNLARFDGVRYGRRADLEAGQGLDDLYARSRAEGFGPEVQRRIMLGTYVLSAGYYDAYYNTAMKARRLIKQDFDAAFAHGGTGGAGRAGGCDAILMPTAPGPAFRLGEKTTDPLAMYLEDAYTVTINLAGLPAISVPTGWADVDGSRLPVAAQLVGRPFDEPRLLRLARTLERGVGF